MNKTFFGVLAALALMLAPSVSNAALGFKGEAFEKVFYLTSGGAGAQNGMNKANAKAFADTDLMAIEAGMVITKVFVVVDTAITGTTNLDLGDDDDADGFVDGSQSITLGTPGMYSYAAGPGGAYMRHQGVVGSDVYVCEAAKYYSAAGKELKLDVTGTNTAGAARVVVQGYKAAY